MSKKTKPDPYYYTYESISKRASSHKFNNEHLVPSYAVANMTTSDIILEKMARNKSISMTMKQIRAVRNIKV